MIWGSMAVFSDWVRQIRGRLDQGRRFVRADKIRRSALETDEERAEIFEQLILALPRRGVTCFVVKAT